MRAASPQLSLTPAGLPAGRRVPRGNMRWYLVHTPMSMEHATADKLLKLIPKNLLADAFTLSKERWEKRNGVWSIRRVQMYPEYLFVVSSDAHGLNSALQKLSFHVDLVGATERSIMPLSEDARAFFERVAGSERVIRSSTAVILHGELSVTDGPLVGCEASLPRSTGTSAAAGCAWESPDGAFWRRFRWTSQSRHRSTQRVSHHSKDART